MIQRLLLGVAAGLLGGALVGLVEALFILSTVAQATEYAALFFAAVLYAAVGAALGVGVGLILALLGRLWRSQAAPTTYTLSFMAVTCLMGHEVAGLLLDRFAYDGQGVPDTIAQLSAAGFVLLAAFILWLGPIFLTRTPFKIVLKPRGTLALFSAIIALAGVFSFAPSRGSPHGTLHPDRASDAPDDAPNLLLIVVDSLRADAVGADVREGKQTRHMDGLAAESVVYERAFASSSWSRPSMATILSGLSPSAHGVTSEIAVLPDEVETLAEALVEAGYVTGGLPNRFDLGQAFNFQQGFDYYRLLEPEYALGAVGSASQLSLFELARRHGLRLGEDQEVTRYYQPADVVLSHAREFIDARGDGRPWFLVVHLMDPSAPSFDHALPDREQVAGLEAGYAQRVQWMDGELGTFFEWMREEGHYSDAAILLTADHGVELLDHGGWGPGATLYDELLHVPLMLKLPGGQRGGERVREQARLLDIAPTLADLAGHPGEPRWQGRSLLSPQPVPRILFAETRYRGNRLMAVRSEGWKFIMANGGNPRGLGGAELYRVATDINERQNLVGRSPALQSRMELVLLRELGAAMRVSVADTVTELDEATAARLRTLGYLE